MNSFLLTSRKKLSGNDYLAPVGLNVRALRVRSVIIDNPLQNVVGHKFYLEASNTAPSAGQEFVIPDGNYDESNWASTVERMLNDAASSVQSTSELQAGTYADTTPMTFEVRYNKGTRRMEFLAKVKNSFARDVYLWFDQSAADYLGANASEKFVWERANRSAGRNLRTTPFTVLQNPRYFRMASRNLSAFGYAFDDNPRSATLCVVPINHDGPTTVWENPNDVFFVTQGNETVPVNNFIHLEFLLEESLVPLEVTDFAVTFDILA